MSFKLNKKLFFRIHSWIGIKLSILFFIVCFSGTLATLSHEMDWLFIPEMRAIPQDKLASKNEIVRNIQAQYPNGRIQFWSATEEPYLCDIVYIIDEGELTYGFVNRYTGALQGHANLTFARFFRDLHYYLFIPFQIGHFTVLIFAFLLLISFVTALLFYKKWYKKLFQLTINKGPLVFFRSLHRLVGVWSVPFTLLFSITGIWYFIERANIGGVSDIANTSSPEAVDTVRLAEGQILSYSVNYDSAIAVAQQEIPSLVIKDILPPSAPGKPLYVNGTSGVPLVRNRANRVYLDPFTYEVLKVQRAESLNTVTWLNDIADPLHFGYWGGLTTKIIWFVFGLGISSLILTGIWISLKRKMKSKAKQKAIKMGGWIYVNGFVYGTLLVFMYFMLIDRYNASAMALATITAGWLAFIALAWYIFIHKLKAD
ncbi:PepSY-associated TM helix domain-containing protein [Fulvivirga kasyanovii]|uniref:PepSY domain-containing protein n=1 Tax=Fulvivirga kasyanovii TaxID=396812 RepID=A0ABW9RMT1_9BACT|nr:PepSY-associated TM helix domain-containing protein [Fulvivirga kasyanovii]MTI24679.1 PepSY domain-containing protein [Fulvivirga kasyanovii]